jgi:hypothetical protein
VHGLIQTDHASFFRGQQLVARGTGLKTRLVMAAPAGISTLFMEFVIKGDSLHQAVILWVLKYSLKVVGTWADQSCIRLSPLEAGHGDLRAARGIFTSFVAAPAGHRCFLFLAVGDGFPELKVTVDAGQMRGLAPGGWLHTGQVFY